MKDAFDREVKGGDVIILYNGRKPDEGQQLYTVESFGANFIVAKCHCCDYEVTVVRGTNHDYRFVKLFYVPSDIISYLDNRGE